MHLLVHVLVDWEVLVFLYVDVVSVDKRLLSILLYVTVQPFKVAIVCPLLKKPSLDSGIYAKYGPISSFLLVFKILENIVATVCDLCRNYTHPVRSKCCF